MIRGAWIRSRILLALALAFVLGGCADDTIGPDTGSLEVSVSGLPGGTAASLTVTGPGGYDHSLTGSETLTGLAPGSYTIAAGPVSAGSELYAASPESQNVTVNGGATAISTVTYGAASGALEVTVSGLPDGAEGAVTVTGPGAYSRQVTASTTLTGLLPGTYLVAAQPVEAGSTQFTASPPTQESAVSRGTTASATVTYAETASSGLNLRIDGVYLTQSVQAYNGSVPLVADRDAFLRVFVTASEANVISPAVRVRFYHGGVLASEQTITRVGTTPLSPQEGTLGSSWNLVVPRTLVRPNLSILVDVDPANTHAETDETDNHFPASGTPLPLQVQSPRSFRVTLVPVKTNADGRTGDVTSGNRDQYLAAAMRLHPLSSYDAVVGAQLTVPSTVPALEADNGNNSWNQILSQLQARRVSDGSSRYYYGVVNPSYSSGVAGMGYVGFPVAMGWDKLPSAASVAAHEWGHNWNRNHAPCGAAANPDVNYPYSGGTIGVYGFDVAAGVLKPTTSHDLMGYCSDEWISDYTYKAVLQYRSAESDVGSSMSGAIQPTLVVWGRIENGRPVLEPAFQATTLPSLPRGDGPYAIEARSADGARVFSLNFSPYEIADDPNGGKHFAFAVPLTRERNERIEHLRFSGAAGSTTLSRRGEHAAHIQITPSGAGRVALTWDAARTPMVVVRDPRTSEILSFARGGRAEVVADQPDLALTLTDQIRSREVFVRVPAR